MRHMMLALALLTTAAPPLRAQTSTETFPMARGENLMTDYGGPFFANCDSTRLRAMLVQQVCQILGGGCVYTCRTIAESHAGMGVNQAHFLRLVEALQIARERRGAAFRSQNRLLAALTPMNRDIITR